MRPPNPETAFHVVVGLALVAFLAIWAWFWTGPEERWERDLYRSAAPATPAELKLYR